MRVAATRPDRLEGLDWPGVRDALRERPFAALPGVLSRDECEGLARLYDEGAAFRSRVVMERHRFGAGEYKYFAEPLPEPVAELRERLYLPNRFRPVAGARGVYRNTVRHGLSRVLSGRRHALGLIFHDAR